MGEPYQELNLMQALELLELPVVYCPADTVRRQYRLLAKRYHPDNTRTGNEERFEDVREAYDFFSDYIEEDAGQPQTDGWKPSFAVFFQREAENYAPPSGDLGPKVEEVRKALAKRPVDYEGLLLRAEWLEHNLTDGSMDGTDLLDILGQVQEVRSRVEKARKRIHLLSDRIGTAEEAVNRCILLGEKCRETPLFGSAGPFRAKISAVKEYREEMRKAEGCMAKMQRYREDLSRLEQFCRESVNCPGLPEKVQQEKIRLDHLADTWEEVRGKGRHFLPQNR